MDTLRDQLQRSLGGAYTIERELGGGGMAHVFVATETRLNRRVVVKVLSPELAAGVSAERFEREIQMVAHLQQANIVPLLSAGEMDGIPYFTMPLVEGESLRNRLATGKPLSAVESVGILRDVARALSYAHAHGVVHRDIKPDNILLSHGAAVVTDFGIAKAVSASRTDDGSGLTQAGMSIGTPAYMAPEQALGDPSIDHRTDIYAFGCLAYELLTGRPPFTAPTLQRLVAAHVSDTPASLRDAQPDLAPVLAGLIMQCLEKLPDNRPASADEIVRVVDALVKPTGGDASGLTLAARGRPTARSVVAVVLGAVLVAAVGGGAWLWSRRAPSSVNDRSIAVLPLVNLSGDKANDYFGEGLAEEITGALGKAGLRVIGRGSARTMAAKGLDAREIARQLRVGSVLQGSVQRSEQQVRISVSLTSAVDGELLWSGKYDRQFKDVFAVQDEIAQSVANELAVRIRGARGSLVRNETADPDAHSLYLQGLYLWNRRTVGTVRQAIQLFEQAVARDPQYARAHAGIAMAYVVLPSYDDLPTDEILNKARDAARRALSIDSTLAEAHAVLGWANATQWRNREAAQDFARALALDSTLAIAHYWHSLLLFNLGRFDDDTMEIARALALEPTSIVMRSSAGLMQFSARRFAQADELQRHALSLDPGSQVARSWLALILVERGYADSAIAVMKEFVGTAGMSPSTKVGILAYAYARARRPADARAVLAKLSRGNTLPASGAIAMALDALGERPRAIEVLTRAVNEHDQLLQFESHTPPFDGLRRDPRAAPLFAKMATP